MNSGKIVAGGRTVDGTEIEGSIRGPRGPKNPKEEKLFLGNPSLSMRDSVSWLKRAFAR